MKTIIYESNKIVSFQDAIGNGQQILVIINFEKLEPLMTPNFLTFV